MNAPKSAPDIYAEQALWRCLNRQSGLEARINGALAQVLKNYPEDYELTFLSTEAA